MCFYGLFHRFDWLERNSGSTGLCPTPNVGPLSPPCCPQVARVLPSNCKATSHCAAFSQALMAALHAMVSWPWRVRWSNEKVFLSDLQAPRCLVVTWEMAPSCCLHFHAAHLGQNLQSTAPFPSLFASTSVDVHERWWPVRFELLVTFCSQPFNCVDPPNHLGMCETKLKHVHVQLCGWNVGRRWKI